MNAVNNKKSNSNRNLVLLSEILKHAESDKEVPALMPTMLPMVDEETIVEVGDDIMPDSESDDEEVNEASVK